MNLTQLKQKELIAFFLIAVGVLLRCFGFSDWSLSNDELSALHRLDYASFSELIQKGVWVDGHPALVQVFLYYWTQIFGNTPFIVRLPFVCLSIGSLIFFYRLASDFLNKNAALFALALFVPSQLFILYGQIARPYSVGLFFIMGFFFYLFQFLNEKTQVKTVILSILFGIGASLSHYFATLGVATILLLGFLFLKKGHIKGYFAICFGIALLFLPHLTITLNHISIGGVGWLPPPESDFLFRFIQYSLNSSPLFYGIIIAAIGVFIFSKSAQINLKKQGTLLILFLLPYSIAYYYSIHKSPVLQFSVLIFSAPFFFLWIASFVKKTIHPKVIMLTSLFVLALGSYSLINGRDFYKRKQFANFEEVIALSAQLTKKYNSDHLVSIANTNNADYFNYYIELVDSTFNFDIATFSSPEQVGNAIELISNHKGEFVLVSFANVPVPAEIHEFAKQKFPIVEFHNRFFNSEVILYKRETLKRETINQTNYLATKTNGSWNVNRENLQDTLFYKSDDSIAYFQDINDVYALTYKDTLKNWLSDTHRYITMSAMMRSDSVPNGKFVFSVDRNGENVYWRGPAIAPFYRKDDWYPFLFVVQCPPELQPNDQITIFFWNPNQSSAYIDDFRIQSFLDSDYNYYEF